MTQFGVAFFPTDYSIQPVELARALEERGLDSLYVTEHTHIPTSRKTPLARWRRASPGLLAYPRPLCRPWRRPLR